jgi:16S rRNA (cytidine1402-2'-O)-methyltransferase
MPPKIATVHLIPTTLAEDSYATLPNYILPTIKSCEVFYVENERTTRRFFKALDKTIVIDNYKWHTIGEANTALRNAFIKDVKAGSSIGILSEAGCPAIADPGQILISLAQELNAKVIPYVGPSSILLALMASGFNGQQFTFNGYLPIENLARIKKIQQLEQLVIKEDCTQIFIETPYRNNPLAESIIKNCSPSSKLCIACNLTAADEIIQTKTIAEWKNQLPDLHKKPTIFLLGK